MNAPAALAGLQGPHLPPAAAALRGPLDPLLDLVDFGLMLIDAQGQVRGLNRWLRERLGDSHDPTGRRLGDVWAGRIDPRLLLELPVTNRT